MGRGGAVAQVVKRHRFKSPLHLSTMILFVPLSWIIRLENNLGCILGLKLWNTMVKMIARVLCRKRSGV